MDRYFISLELNGSEADRDVKWFLPTKKSDNSWKPGKWMPEIPSDQKPISNQYQIHQIDDLINSLYQAIFEVEPKGQVKKTRKLLSIIGKPSKSFVSSARLTRKLESWNEKTDRLLAADFAEHILDTFGKDLVISEWVDENLLRELINVSRSFASGNVKINKLLGVYSKVEQESKSLTDKYAESSDMVSSLEVLSGGYNDAHNIVGLILRATQELTPSLSINSLSSITSEWARKLSQNLFRERKWQIGRFREHLTDL